MHRLALILIVAAAACGKTPKPGKTPKATIAAYEQALRDADAGAIYDMLSTRARGALDGQLRTAKAAWLSHPTLRARYDTERDVLTAARRRGYRDVTALQLVVLDVKRYGERARVKLSTLYKGHEGERTVMLQHENGVWTIDSDDALGDLRLQLMPPAPVECVTFT